MLALAPDVPDDVPASTFVVVRSNPPPNFWLEPHRGAVNANADAGGGTGIDAPELSSPRLMMYEVSPQLTAFQARRL